MSPSKRSSVERDRAAKSAASPRRVRREGPVMVAEAGAVRLTARSRGRRFADGMPITRASGKVA
jgi:hypothetical protein